MENLLNISSRLCFKDIASRLIFELSPENIDYIYSENRKVQEKKRYFFSIKTHNQINIDTVANQLAKWILTNFECEFVSAILKESFIPFEKSESAEIVDDTLESMDFFDKSLNKRNIVNSLTNYFKSEKNISIEGFLRFRASAYRGRIERRLNESIERFFARKEYDDFLELLKTYINESKPGINLMHVKINHDGTFELYDFKRTKLTFSYEDAEAFKNPLTAADKLVSILISIIPKRIIWHNNSNINNENLIKTLKEIFGDRFSECGGCEICDKNEKK